MNLYNTSPGGSLDDRALEDKRRAMAAVLAAGGNGGSALNGLSQVAMGAAQGYQNKKRAEARLLQNQMITANQQGNPLDSLIQKRNSWQGTPSAQPMQAAQPVMYGPQSLNGAP